MAEKDELKTQKVVELIEGMSVLELSELIKALEEKFGVKAVPVSMATPTSAAPISAPPSAEKVVEEKVEFDVVLKSFEDKKIPVIKAVREVTTLGLKEAKELVESAPCVIKAKITKEEAEAIAKKITAAGGICEVR